MERLRITNSESATWELIQPTEKDLPIRSNPVAVSITDTSFVIMGGRDNESKLLNDLYAFNAELDVFENQRPEDDAISKGPRRVIQNRDKHKDALAFTSDLN